MLNDFVELVYKEIVKGKLKDLKKNNPYSLNEKSRLKLIHSIDSIFSKIVKILFLLVLIAILIMINAHLIFVVLLIHFIYKKYIENGLKNQNLVLKAKVKEVLQDNIKLKIKGLFIIMIMLNFSRYKKFYMMIIITLLVFTINDIYSNIKNIKKSSL